MVCRFALTPFLWKRWGFIFTMKGGFLRNLPLETVNEYILPKYAPNHTPPIMRTPERDHIPPPSINVTSKPTTPPPGPPLRSGVKPKNDGFVKSPSAALRFNFVVAAHIVSALHSSLFARLASGAFYETIALVTFTRSSKDESSIILLSLIIYVTKAITRTNHEPDAD